jgi:hypothetical protein
MNAFVSCEPEQSYLVFSSERLTGEAYRWGSTGLSVKTYNVPALGLMLC